MPSNTDENETNYGLSGLWNDLSNHKCIWYHRTISYGYEVVHVLDKDGWEIALLNNATRRWGIRTCSPLRWYPLPDDAIPYEFQGDEELDSALLDSIDTTIEGGFREISD
nr:hypothetical protein [Enterobacter mori]